MWTLEAMQRFVLTHSAEVECKSCAGSRKHGTLYFKACLVIYADWDTETCTSIARVGCDVMLDRKSCFCQLTTEEFDWGRKEAHRIIQEKLRMFLREYTPPEPSAPPMEVLTLVAGKVV